MAEKQVIDDYSRMLIADLPTLIGKALADLAPADLWFGNGQAHFAINRREPTPKGVKLGLNPSGPTDPDVPVLKVAAPTATPARCCSATPAITRHSRATSTGSAAITPASRRAPSRRLIPGSPRCSSSCARAIRIRIRAPSWRTSEQHGQALADEVTRVAGATMTPVRGKLRAAFQIVDLDSTPSRASS